MWADKSTNENVCLTWLTADVIDRLALLFSFRMRSSSDVAWSLIQSVGVPIKDPGEILPRDEPSVAERVRLLRVDPRSVSADVVESGGDSLR